MIEWLRLFFTDPTFFRHRVKVTITFFGVALTSGFLPITTLISDITSGMGDSCGEGTGCAKIFYYLGIIIAVGAQGIKTGDRTSVALEHMGVDTTKLKEVAPKNGREINANRSSTG